MPIPGVFSSRIRKRIPPASRRMVQSRWNHARAAGVLALELDDLGRGELAVLETERPHEIVARLSAVLIGNWKRAACAAFIESVSPLRTTSSRDPPSRGSIPAIRAAEELGRRSRAPDLEDLDVGVDHRLDEQLGGCPARRAAACALGEHVAEQRRRFAPPVPSISAGFASPIFASADEDEGVRLEREQRRGPGRVLGHERGDPDAGRRSSAKSSAIAARTWRRPADAVISRMTTWAPAARASAFARCASPRGARRRAAGPPSCCARTGRWRRVASRSGGPWAPAPRPGPGTRKRVEEPIRRGASVSGTWIRRASEGQSINGPDDRIVVAFTTVPDAATGARIARALVEERLAACVSRVAGLVSIYRFEGAVHEDGEDLLVIKTSRRRVAGARAPAVRAAPLRGAGARGRRGRARSARSTRAGCSTVVTL